VLFLFQRFVMPPPAPVPSAPAATPNQNQAASAPAASQTGASASPAPSQQAQNPPAPVVAATVTESNAREIVVETSKVKAVFSNHGATIVHWILKEYRTDAGQPLDIVPGGAGPDAMKPFTLTVDDQRITDRLKNAIYRVTVNGAAARETVDATASPQTLVFEAASADGFSVKKTFVLEPTSYVVVFGADVRAGDQRMNPAINWGPGLGDDIARAKPGSFFSPRTSLPAQGIVHNNGKVERIGATAAGMREGPLRYAGIDDHYFVSMLLNEQNTQSVRMDFAPNLVPQPDDPNITGRYVNYSVRFQSPQDQSRFFFGPKEFETLRAIDPEMTRVINFGIFAWLAAPLLGALKWVHGFIGNWGWAIIVLTMLINIALFPLRHKSMVSMRKMQAIQPRMKAIQDRYAKYKITDPEKNNMNTEVMALYKAEGVNPASGCIPMLLTMPFLLAFYGMLGQAIEIRGADFFGWIHNLSAPDPFYILPLITGAVQFWQSRLTPTPNVDPTQQKVMMMMPLMITVMSFGFASGLVLYWLFSTLFGFGQQYLTNYLIGAPPRPAVK
jgi:YidC/Oxa1 family membrane protein insertase